MLTADQIKSVAWQNGRWYTTTFTAMFAANEFTIHFVPGDGGLGAGNMADMLATYGVNFVVPGAGDETTFYRPGYIFAGWQTDEADHESDPTTPRVLKAGDNVADFFGNHGDTITLTALWEPKPITITWIAGKGGTIIENDVEGATATTKIDKP